MAWIAARAHGVATRPELLRAGLSGSRIDRELRKGGLIRQYPGVYRVGHAAPSVDASYMAAVKACGEEAGISGRAAGHLCGLLRGKAPPPEVSTPKERQVRGLRVRRARRQTTKVRGIPVTSVPETLVDLAAELSKDELALACHEAGVRYRTTPRHVEAVLARRPKAKGAAKLRAVIHGDAPVLIAALERAFFQVLREERLPLPETNRHAGGRRVDCRWPDELTVELDSFRYHNSRVAWERDREREREARKREEEFRRYTWADVVEDRREMVRELRKLLSSGCAPRSIAGQSA